MAISSRVLSGDKLRYQRDLKVWSQEMLSERSGVTVGTISRLETGYHHARQSTVNKLADAFGCSPNELLEWENRNGGSGGATTTSLVVTIMAAYLAAITVAITSSAQAVASMLP